MTSNLKVFICIHLFFLISKSFLFYCCSSTVVCILPSPLLSHHTCPHHPLSILHPMTLSMSLLYLFLEDPFPSSAHYHIIPPPLSSGYCQCSLFQCLLLYFACLFVLLIKLHLQERSYGIVFHCLGNFTQHNALQTHLCCHKGQELFLSFYCIIFHHVNVPQFLNYSFTDRHLGCL